MAIFNNGDSPAAQTNSKNTTIITQGAIISGEIKVDCSLFIDGEIEGRISSQGEITIGAKGSIVGDISAKNVLISGRVKGTIDSDRIAIQAGGSVEGTIISSELLIEAKGSFIGESKIKETGVSPKKNKSETV
ncbi:MAG: polymer-forming cytoskeletal protein [Campylobacterota bacterium]|nr:polymer-forming cytoskeletal protein [Campylobacterota bacterium]